MSAALPIAIEDLVFRPRGRPVLDGLAATLTSRGVTALIGPNGAGKSVTLRILDGLIRPESGRVRFGDRPASAIRRALVFQTPALIRASVAANLRLALVPQRLTRAETSRRVAAVLERVGLGDRSADAARKLSGGEQQRLALGRAIVTEPELLLLDEPTASLDPGATEEIETLVAAIARSGTKVILVSHNLGQVARLAEDVLVMAAGKAVEHGSARQVLTHPERPQTRAFLNGELPWTAFAAAC